MKWNRYIISMLLIAISTSMMADSIYSQPVNDNSYDKRVDRYRRHWASLIPNQFVVQNAGNMGLVSAGIGWRYGRRKQWETHLLWGFIPKYESTRAKLTMTVKENFIPWSIDLKQGKSIEPLLASIYLNTVYGHEFWRTQPNRYPDDYYQFMSTKFRLNIALGQQFTWQIPKSNRKYAKSVTLFYEVSSCDLYIRAKFTESSIPLKDIIGLSIGVKLQTL